MKLEVKSVRYFNTRRGVGYQCKTNIDNIEIWNDGNGGGTFVTGNTRGITNTLYNLTERYLESLIDKYETQEK